jgi:hypothetical protein
LIEVLRFADVNDVNIVAICDPLVKFYRPGGEGQFVGKELMRLQWIGLYCGFHGLTLIWSRGSAAIDPAVEFFA